MTALSLSRVGINGFRGLRHLDLNGLGRINILVGGNNSGKTSVLEALSILCQPYNPYEWLAMVRRRDFGGLDETRIQSLRWCFTQILSLVEPDHFVDTDCEFICQGTFPLTKLHVTYTEFFGEPSFENVRFGHDRNGMIIRSQKDKSQLGEPVRGAKLEHFPDWDASLDVKYLYGLTDHKLPPQLTIWEGVIPAVQPKLINAASLKTETLTPYSYQINKTQVKSQSKQIFKQDRMVDLLRDFDGDVEAIEIASFFGDRPAIYIKHKQLGIAPLSIFGDAMRRAVLLASTLLSLKYGGVLLIDEVEAGIHVSALGRVFEWLVRAVQALRVQVFITTHSLESLDAMLAVRNRIGNDDIVAFHLDQTPEITRAKRFSGDLLHRLRFERGLDVR